MNGGLDGRASGGEKRKVYPNNPTFVEGRNLSFMLSVCSVILNPSSASWTGCKVFINRLHFKGSDYEAKTMEYLQSCSFVPSFCGIVDKVDLMTFGTKHCSSFL